MAGYANRVVRIAFPDLTEADTDELFVVIRNPKTMTVDELTPQDVALDPATGQPVDTDLAAQRSREIIARLVVAWRMYDASDFSVDPDTGIPTEQAPLPLPATAELVRRLPMAAIQAINDKISEAIAPK